MKTKETKLKIRNSILKAWLLLVIACATVLICSTFANVNSATYASNFGYNMGLAQAVMNGAVPYKDVLINIGPLALLWYTLFNIVGDYTFVLLMQMISAYAFVIVVYRVMKLFLSDVSSFVATIVVAVITYTSSAYVTGGVVEEFLLPFFAYLVFCLIECEFKKKQFSVARTFFVSISIGLIVWTKFNLIVLPIIFILAYMLLSIKNKQVKSMAINLIAFVFVVGAISMSMIWYLYLKKGLSHFVSSYIIASVNLPVSLKNIVCDLFLLLLAISGIVVALIKHRDSLLIVSISFGLYILSLIFTATENVNVLPLAVIAMLGIALIGEMLEKVNCLNKTKNIVKVASCLLAIVYCCVFSPRFWILNNEKVNFGQEKIVSTISGYEIENPTLLCYKMDCFGLYNNTGININTKVFANNGIVENREDLRIQYDLELLDKETDFVLMTEDNYIANKKKLLEDYKYVGEYKITTTNKFVTYEIDTVLLMAK